MEEAAQVLIILDAAGITPVEEVIARLPEREGPLLQYRLSEWVAGEPSDAAPPILEQQAQGIARMVKQLREDVDALHHPVDYYVSGQGPLPLFVELGQELSPWATPVTFYNRRPDGSWDELPLDQAPTEASASPFFEEVIFHDGRDPEGRRAAFVIFLAWRPFVVDNVSRFLEKQGEALATLVEVRTTRPKTLGRSEVVQAHAELRALIADLHHRHPQVSGLTVWIAGPAVLGFVVGRTLLAPGWPGEALLLSYRANEIRPSLVLPYSAQSLPQVDAPSIESDLQAARAGEPAALGRLFAQVRPWLQRQAKLLLRSTPTRPAWIDAEDLATEAALRFLGHLSAFKGETSAALYAYLRLILSNLEINYRRSQSTQRRGRELLSSLETSPAANQHPDARLGPEERLEHKQSWQLLLTAMAKLPERQREVLLLQLGAGLSIQDLAERLHSPPEALTNLLSAGVKNLRQLIESADAELAPPGHLSPQALSVIGQYLNEVAQGRRPDRNAALATHPGLAAEIDPQLDAIDWLAERLR